MLVTGLVFCFPASPGEVVESRVVTLKEFGYSNASGLSRIMTIRGVPGTSRGVPGS